MDMVDMVIQFGFPFENREVYTFLQRPDLELLVGLQASRPTYWRVYGTEPHRKTASYMLTRV